MAGNRKKLTAEERKDVYLKYSGHCAYCGKEIEPSEMQVDHLVPLYLGGKDEADNWMPSCRMCNHYKSTYTLEKLRGQLSRLPEQLDRSFDFRLAERYGLVSKNPRPVFFYFENHGTDMPEKEGTMKKIIHNADRRAPKNGADI